MSKENELHRQQLEDMLMERGTEITARAVAGTEAKEVQARGGSRPGSRQLRMDSKRGKKALVARHTRLLMSQNSMRVAKCDGKFRYILILLGS